MQDEAKFQEASRYLVVTNGQVRRLKETLSDALFREVLQAATSAYLQGVESGKATREPGFLSYEGIGVCGLCDCNNCRGGCFR